LYLNFAFIDGGWLASHPLPADKGSFGNFEALAQENKQIIKKILESTPATSSIDDEILSKLQNLYASCLDETMLDDIGQEPLLHLVRTVRKLFKGNDTDITSTGTVDHHDKGLTAAITFLHSRGKQVRFRWLEENAVDKVCFL